MKIKILLLSICFFLISCNDYEDLNIPSNLPEIKFEYANLDLLEGIYTSEILSNDLASGTVYGFVLSQNADSEMFFLDYGDGKRENNLKLKREFSNKDKGQMVFKITEANGYYTSRLGQFLTVYAKNISEDGDKLTLVIATKNGSNSIASSAGGKDALSETLEEAKEIYPPEETAIFKNNMWKYANLWMHLTKTKL